METDNHAVPSDNLTSTGLRVEAGAPRGKHQSKFYVNSKEENWTEAKGINHSKL